jgi:hypothetical protein
MSVEGLRCSFPEKNKRTTSVCAYILLSNETIVVYDDTVTSTANIVEVKTTVSLVPGTPKQIAQLPPRAG